MIIYRFYENAPHGSATFQAQAHLRKHGGLFCWEVTKMALLGISERVGLCFVYFV